MSNQGGQSNRWDVMSIREYTDRANQPKTSWTKIGVAFTNKNGSINVQLDAFPIDGKLQLQVPLTPEEKERLGFGQGRQQQGGQRQQGQSHNPRNAGQQQRNSNAQRYGSRGPSQPQQQSFGPPPPQQVPPYQQDEYHPGGPDGQEAGWEVNGVWITDARQLPQDHPDFIPF